MKTSRKHTHPVRIDPAQITVAGNWFQMALRDGEKSPLWKSCLEKGMEIEIHYGKDRVIYLEWHRSQPAPDAVFELARMRGCSVKYPKRKITTGEHVANFIMWALPECMTVWELPHSPVGWRQTVPRRWWVWLRGWLAGKSGYSSHPVNLWSRIRIARGRNPD